MNKKEIKVFHFDNEETESSFCGNALETLGKNYNIDVKFVSATTIPNSENILKQNGIDLIIIDLLVGTEVLGERILSFLSGNKSQTPVWILTHASELDVDLNNLKKRYNIVTAVIKKTHNLDELKDKFSEFLELNELLIDESIQNSDKSDYKLQSDINTIGQNDLSALIIKLKSNNEKKYNIKKIGQFSSGLSGAILFEAFYEDHLGNKKSILLKTSKDKTAIEKEYNNISLYDGFPPRLRIDYLGILKTILTTERVAAIVIENAKNSKTLFKFLIDTNTKPEDIINVLTNIFLNEGLSQFYKDNLRDKEKFIDSCLNDLDIRRISYIKRSIEELEPILKLYKQYYNEELLNSILGDKSYLKLRANNLIKEEFFKYKVLCHGDLHSKNLLVSNFKNPTIIDTGGINPKGAYWCFDVARLIVNLIMEGIDYNEIEFFKLESIEKWISQSVIVIEGVHQLEISNENSPNKGVFSAINWLRSNVENIYIGFYEPWEFQLGISVEFLKASYKSISLPPGKRALAILAACEAVRIANKSLKAKLKK